MALNALKEPALRCAPGSPPRTRFRGSAYVAQPSSPSRRPLFTSRVLAALDGRAEAAMLLDASGIAEAQKPPVGRPRTKASSATSTNTTELRGRTLAEPTPLHPLFAHKTLASNVGEARSPKPSASKAKKAPPAAPKTKTKRVANATTTQSMDPDPDPAAAQENLPVYSYTTFDPTPTVVYTRHEDEANDLVQTLRGPLGFDMEWRIFWRRGAKPAERRTALVQLSDEKTILLVQVSAMPKFPQKVKEVIESASIVKTGANIKNDAEKLFRDFGIKPRGLVELGALAKHADPTHAPARAIVSLARMVAAYARRTLLKDKVRTSDWERMLDATQVEYAANDAHCAIVVYKRLLAIAVSEKRSLDPAAYTADLSQVHAARRVVDSSAAPISTAGSTPSAVSQASIPSTATSGGQTSSGVPTPSMSARHLQAYNLWHGRRLPLDEICATMRPDAPLKPGTVISYVVLALQADARLPYDDGALMALVQQEAGSWARHREWLLSQQS